MKSAAASEGPKNTRPSSDSFKLLKSTSPSGNQASGETGRSTSMIGSSARANGLDSPSRNPSGAPTTRASAYPCNTSFNESQVNRRMP